MTPSFGGSGAPGDSPFGEGPLGIWAPKLLEILSEPSFQDTPSIACQVKGLLKDHNLATIVSTVLSALGNDDTREHVSFTVMDTLVENMWAPPNIVAELLRSMFSDLLVDEGPELSSHFREVFDIPNTTKVPAINLVARGLCRHAAPTFGSLDAQWPAPLRL